MSTPTNPFAAMMEQAQAQMEEMAKAVNPALETFSAEGFEKLIPTMPKDWMEGMFGKGASSDGLDAKTKLLLTLAGLTCQGVQAEMPFRMAVRHAHVAGATVQEISETIAMMGMFAGLPASARAAKLAQDALADSTKKETGE